MTVTISNIKPTMELIRKIDRFMASKVWMKNVVEDIAERILDLTDKGLSYRSKPLKKYSKLYAEQKGTTHVDLKLTELMLKSLKAKAVTPRRGKVYIESRSYPKKKGGISTYKLAEVHTMGKGKMPKREFMNVTKGALDKIVKERFDNEIQRMLGRRK